jgi:hypothetical protein
MSALSFDADACMSNSESADGGQYSHIILQLPAMNLERYSPTKLFLATTPKQV